MIAENIGSRLAIFALALAVGRAPADKLYVNTFGSDSNPGTSAQPLRTITYAYSLAGPGTTILVAPGVYDDYRSGWGLHLAASGTASNPIVLQSQIRGGAVIDGKNSPDRNQAIYLDGSYNVVDGFEIRNGPRGGIAIYGNGNQFLHNEIHHNGNPNSSSTNGLDGVYSDPSTSDNIYAGNHVHDNGRSGSNLDHGLYLCGQNELVINNILIRNASCGLQIGSEALVSGLRVYNNVMAWNGNNGIIVTASLYGVDIRNNIFYQNGHYGLASWAAAGSGVVVDDNLAFGNGYGDYDFTGGGSSYAYTLGTSISLDPRFVNETQFGFDAHLGVGSPAIGVGVNFGQIFSTDLAGDARPLTGAWDLGSYIYNGPSTPPLTHSTAAPTVTLTATPTTVFSGQEAILSWTCANATNLTWVGLGEVTLDGNVRVWPVATRTFTVMATGPGGTNYASATLTVNR